MFPPTPNPAQEAPTPELDRRRFLGASSAVLLATFAGEASSQQLEDTRKARQDRSATNPGPENTMLRQANPQTFDPPSTDHGEVESFWSSFSTSALPPKPSPLSPRPSRSSSPQTPSLTCSETMVL